MSLKSATKIMLWLLTSVMIFHLCILLKIIPYDITWGGRLKTDADMYAFESLSLIINLFLFLVLLIKGKFMRPFLPLKLVNVTLWFFLVLFALNTVGNVLAETNFEKFFALITLAFSVLIWIILRKGKSEA